MHWKNIPLESIVSRKVIYFDEDDKRKEICRKIFKVLMIDCFPDLNELKYWIFKNKKWESRVINYSEVLNSVNDAFDLKLKDLFVENPSNIIFTSNGYRIDGVIHFTNYESREVFVTLYHNYHVFERNLRFLLRTLGYNVDSFIRYFDYKKRESKKDDVIKFWNNKIKNIREEKSEKLKPFETVEFSDLLNFAISSSHPSEKLMKIGLIDGIQKNKFSTIITLRNTIMHSRIISGEDIYLPHSYEKFEEFFNSVVNFKQLFQVLSNRISIITTGTIDNQNKATLDKIDKMDHQSINNYFYSNS